MKFLLDTNVIIDLDPLRTTEQHAIPAVVARLQHYANAGACSLWRHPAQDVDINQDRNHLRAQARTTHFAKYPMLECNVQVPPQGKTNDWVDDQLLGAVMRNAVDYLVTEDVRLRKKASRAGYGERIIEVREAIALLESKAAERPPRVPNVDPDKVYNLNLDDRFWDSLNADYEGFRDWFRKCQIEHRECFVMRSLEDRSIIGCAIVNPEREPNDIRGKKTLKICCFKIHELHNGKRLGELLLKQVFRHAFANQFDSLFITMYEKSRHLAGLLEEFGFEEEAERRTTNEIQYCKHLHLNSAPKYGCTGLDYHVKFGPFAVDAAVRKYLVPIKPIYHQMLFPELQGQLSLPLQAESCSNGIRKAYVSHAKIQEPTPGSLLFFYRSHDLRAVDCIGVVERCLRTQVPDELERFVVSVK